MSISESLKKLSISLHDQTEEKFQSGKIFTGTFTPEDYRKLLLHNFYLIKAYENPVFDFLKNDYAEKLQLEERRKLSALQKDLASLGITDYGETTAPQLTNIQQAFGILYVMEGSTLGGNVIAKNLAKLDAFRDFSFQYFGIYGDQTGPMWKNFKNVLDEDFGDEDLPDVLTGVQHAYQFLLNCTF